MKNLNIKLSSAMDPLLGSDSDDEQMFSAYQLSMEMMMDEFEDSRSDSDDEQLCLAKQLSMMMTNNSRTSKILTKVSNNRNGLSD